MRKVTLAATQMTCSWEIDDNIAKAERLIREAAGRGASIILIQELFETPYFCIDQDIKYLNLAKPMDRNTTITHMQDLARELNVVLPVSFFERANQAFYNSVAMVDADGTLLGVYRKTHIPNAVGYQEKQFFNPGDTGRKISEANKTDETVLTAMVDLDEIREYREFWNLFRDRRPEHYGPIMTLDGKTRAFG